MGAVRGLVGASTYCCSPGGRRQNSTGGALRLIAVAVAALFHGLHLPAEAHIRGTAWRLAHMLEVCQSAEVRL